MISNNCNIDSVFVVWGFFKESELKSKPTYIIQTPEELFEINEIYKPIELTYGNEIDLHSYKPEDIPSVLEIYLKEARKNQFKSVRIIHGKGKGIQKNIVRKILSQTDFIISYYDAPIYNGSFGATIAELKTGDVL